MNRFCALYHIVKYPLQALPIFLFSISAMAANPETFTTNYNVAARAKLAINTATITFIDTDPSISPIQAQENPITVTVSIRKDPTVTLLATLFCQMTSPLASGSDTIAAGNMTWAATGTGFTGGTMSSTTPQQVGSWSASGSYPGTLSFNLANLWTYATGNYTGTISYTLTAP